LFAVGFASFAFGDGDRTGTLTGTVENADGVITVTAIDRATDGKFKGTIDPKTGRFTIEKLPLGAEYDVIIDTTDARLEGVNLKVPRSDYEAEQPLSKDDIATITETARALNKFEDTVEVMAVVGNIQHAAVVLNKLRTKEFVNSKPGEVIWRLELWHFEKPEETWVKEQDRLALVLYRERIQKTDFDKKALTLDPALSGLKPTVKETSLDVGKVELPGREKGIRIRLPKK